VAKKQVGKTNPFRCFCSESYSQLILMEKPAQRECLYFRSGEASNPIPANQMECRSALPASQNAFVTLLLKSDENRFAAIGRLFVGPTGGASS
jgi:hypothetical protein